MPFHMPLGRLVLIPRTVTGFPEAKWTTIPHRRKSSPMREPPTRGECDMAAFNLCFSQGLQCPCQFLPSIVFWAEIHLRWLYPHSLIPSCTTPRCSPELEPFQLQCQHFCHNASTQRPPHPSLPSKGKLPLFASNLLSLCCLLCLHARGPYFHADPRLFTISENSCSKPSSFLPQPASDRTTVLKTHC